MNRPIKVAEMHQITPGRGHLVRVKGREIALFNLDGVFYAIDNSCTHSRGPLADGRLAKNVVTCPWHGTRYDVTTGKCIAGPATTGVTAYAVQIEGDDILIEVP